MPYQTRSWSSYVLINHSSRHPWKWLAPSGRSRDSLINALYAKIIQHSIQPTMHRTWPHYNLDNQHLNSDQAWYPSWFRLSSYTFINKQTTTCVGCYENNLNGEPVPSISLHVFKHTASPLYVEHRNMHWYISSGLEDKNLQQLASLNTQATALHVAGFE